MLIRHVDSAISKRLAEAKSIDAARKMFLLEPLNPIGFPSDVVDLMIEFKHLRATYEKRHHRNCRPTADSIVFGDDCFSRVGLCFCAASFCHLIRSFSDDQGSSVVDMYNSLLGTWSTAQLSVARLVLAAASVGNVAIFAGGYTGSVLLWMVSP